MTLILIARQTQSCWRLEPHAASTPSAADLHPRGMCTVNHSIAVVIAFVLVMTITHDMALQL